MVVPRRPSFNLSHAVGGRHGAPCTLSLIHISDSAIFRGWPQKFAAARYQSLAADGASLPDCLRVTAYADDEIMAVEHTRYPIYGLQFHPESVLTPVSYTHLDVYKRQEHTLANEIEAPHEILRK